MICESVDVFFFKKKNNMVIYSEQYFLFGLDFIQYYKLKLVDNDILKKSNFVTKFPLRNILKKATF